MGRVLRGQRTRRLRSLVGSLCAPSSRARPITPAAVILALLVVLAASCGDDDEEAEATPRVTTTERETTTTVDPLEAEEQAVIAAYDAAVQAWANSSAPPSPDPENPVITETHTGFMLDAWTDTVSGLQATGLAIKKPDDSQYRYEIESFRVEDVNGQRVAYLEVCTVTDEEQVVVATGGVVSGGLRTIQASDALVNEAGVWKLAEHRVNVTMEGVAGCASE